MVRPRGGPGEVRSVCAAVLSPCRSVSTRKPTIHIEAPTIIRVAADSRTAAVAGAIAGMVRDGYTPILQTIGARALNQATKAISIARGYLEPDGIDMVCTPSFTELEVDGQRRTAVRLEVIRR